MISPPQLIPEKEKSQEWCRKNVQAVMQQVSGFAGGSHMQSKVAWDLYNGFQNESDYDYLTGTDEFRLPARVRFYPIVRPLFDNLKSSMETRPLEPRVFSVDNGSINERKDMMANKIVSTYLSHVFERHDRLTIARQRIAMLKQQAAGQQGPEAQVALQQMEMSLGRVEREAASGQDLLDGSIKKLEQKARTTYQTRKEMLIHSGLEFLMAKYDYKGMFNAGFESLFVTDQEVYKLEEVFEGDDPRVRRCNASMVYYGADMESEYLDEVPWVCEERFLPISEVIAQYGHHMDATEVSDLKGRYNYDAYTSFTGNTSFNSMAVGGGDSCSSGIYSGSIAFSGDLVRVVEVAWKSVSKVLATRTKNKYEEGSYHTHLVADERELKRADEVLVRYRIDWWEGVCIAGDTYARLRKCPFQHRDVRDLGKAYGPYVGFAYNGMDRRPYSRVLAVKDIQVLYNLVLYQIELLVALSSIKGVIMDKAQIPAGMSTKEWFFYLKQGVGVIDSTQEGSNGRRPTFNQFQTYDMSFGTAISQLIQITERLEYLAGRVIGIPPQRMGEVLPQDQVSTHKQAIASSNLTTETMFFKHNKLVRRVLSRVANVLPYAWKEGKRGSYVMGDLGQKILQIESGDLEDAMCDVFISDGGSDQRIMDNLTAAVQNQFTNGQASLSQLLAVSTTKNLRELTETIEQMEKVAVRRSEQGQQQEAESNKELEQIRNQFALLLKKQLTDGEQLKGQVEQMGIQADMQRSQAELQVKMQAEDSKNNTQRGIAEQNTMVELEALSEEKRSNRVEEQLRRLEIGLDAVQNSSKELSSAPAKNKISDR